MKHLLKKIVTPIIERRLVLPLLGWAAGLLILPAQAQAQEAAQVTAPPTEQLPAGFAEKRHSGTGAPARLSASEPGRA
jgi:hypothetical protein